MKKIIVWIAAVLLWASVQFASATYLPGTQGAGIAVWTEWFFNQQDIPAPKTQAQCSEFWWQETYYLSWDADADGLPDLGKQWYFKDNFVYNSASQTRGVALILPRFGAYNGTTVSYHTPTSNMLNVYNAWSQYPLSSQRAWYRYSKVAPLNQPVRAVTSEPLLMEVPTTRLASDAKFQLVFDINFAVFSSWGTNTSDYFVATVSSLADLNPVPNSSKWYMKGWLTHPDGPLRSSDYLNQTTLVSARSINWSSEISHGSECVNVTLKWCGDGIKDTTYGEECDLGAQNGQPGALCTTTCILPPVVQEPDVTILKTVVWAITWYLNNDIVTYKLTYRNIGTGLANNVIIRDQLPAGVTYISSTANPNIGQPTQVANLLTWPTIPTLAPGAQGEIIVQVRITQYAACTPYTNTSSIAASNEPVIYNGNNTSTANFTTDCPNPDVVTQKTVTALSGSYLPGNVVEYTLSYQNIGGWVANGVVVTDTLPSQVTYITNSSTSTPNIGQPTVAWQTLTWNVGTLNPGQSGQIKIRVTINASTPTCTSLIIRNDFTISATNEPPLLLGNNPSNVTFPMQCIDLFSNKTVDKPVVISWDIVTYTITYGNNWNVAWPGTVTDTLPAWMQYIVGSASSTPNVGQPTVAWQVLTWNVGVLPPGSSRTITIQARVIWATLGQTYLNTVCIADDNNYNNNNCGTAISNWTWVVTPIIDLWSNKVVDKPVVVSWDLVTYTITYGNSGNTTAPGTVTDTVPAWMQYIVGSSNSTPNVGQPTVVWQILTWNVGNLPAGSSRTITFQVRVVQATPNQQYVNLVCIADDNNYNNNNCGTAISTTTGWGGNNIDLWSRKIVDKPIVVSWDLVTYTITYGNSGSVAATGIVTDTVPAWMQYIVGSASSTPNVGQPTVAWQTLTWDVGVLPAWSSRTITFQVRVIQATPNQQYVNLVCIADDNNYNNNNCGTATSITSGGNNIDLWSRKIVDKPIVVSWDLVTYTITYGNSGDIAAPGIVTDTVPAWMQYIVGSSNSTPNVGQPTVAWQTLTWNVGVLPVGSSRTITFQVRVVQATPGQTYLNTVCIADDNNYWNNNCGTATSTTTGDSTLFDLSIDKTPKSQIAFSWQDVSFTLTVKNAWPAAVSGFSVNDYLPAWLQFVSANLGATYNAGSKTITRNWLSLNANSSLTLTVVAKYTSTTSEVNWAEICNYRWVSSIIAPNDIDSDPCNGTGNNEDDVSSGKVMSSYLDLNLNKLANGVKVADVFSGEIVDFSLVVGNSGTVIASNFSVNDYLPAWFVFVQASFGWLYNSTTRTLTWSGLNLAPWATTILTFKAIYTDAVERINYAEVCTYNGLNGSNTAAKDIDSDPCNRGANPPVEDDESSASVRPRTASNIFDLSINKLIDGVKVKIWAWSWITYPITLAVTNSGWVWVSNFSVKDYMPAWLDYVVGSANPATATYDTGSRIVTFNSLNIGANQTITLTFNAVYRSVNTLTNYTEICDYRWTLASGNDAKDIDSNPCNRGSNLPIEDDESSASIAPTGGGGGWPTVDVTLNKLVNGVKEYQANNNETVTFKLRATNEGNTTIVNASIVDYLPTNIEYVSGSATTIAPATVLYDATTRKLVWSGLTFTNNSAFELTFRAVYSWSDVKTNYAEICAYNGKTTNTSWLPTSATNPQDLDSDPCNRGATTPVEDDESSALIRPKTGGCTSNCGWGRNYCGDGLIARPNSYWYYEECDEWMDRTKPNYNGKPGGNCSLTCKTSGWWVCGDGVLQYGEVCDQGRNGWKIPVGRPYAWRMCSSSCTLPWVAAPACDYIDPPSIMSNEYLPYRWDLEDIDDLQTSCTNVWAVIRDSLMCKFEVTDAKWSKVSNTNGEFTWIAPCHDPVADRLTKSAYIQVIKSLWYDPDSSQIRPYGFSSSRFNFTYLGEHKISMRLESYKMCVDGTNGMVQQEVSFDQMSKKRVCEMNFAVTKPYMVSRWPLGNFSTDSLTSFLYMPRWEQVFTSPVPKITQKFDVTSEVKDSVNKLVTEYKKVAVVATALPQFGNVLKVPGKDIYFFEWNTDAASITVSDTSVTSLGNKPFTIIVTRGQLVIKWNLSKVQNGMYINASQNGSIKFAMDDKPWVNGVKWCDITQEVNGIFISVNTLISLNHEWNPSSVANTDINKDWCNGWDITIRWVLIGNGIDGVVNNRRSNVNTWFTELTQINADRKEYLLNHGAVVLKYNPTLFDNLPPGAEVLSQVLNTYKK